MFVATNDQQSGDYQQSIIPRSSANQAMTGRPKKFLLDGSTYSKIGMYAATYAKKAHVLRVKPSHARRNSTTLPSTHTSIQHYSTIQKTNPRMNAMVVLSAD